MKYLKKLASILLAMVMVLGLGITALGETNNGKITINDAIVGNTYTIYQILDLESYNETNKAYIYKSTTDWQSFVEGNSVNNIYLITDDKGYVTWKEGADVAAFAKLAKAHAATLSGNQGKVTTSSTTVTFDNLDLGYYLIDTTLGTICSLDTTNNVVVMEEKNEAPESNKKVSEDSSNSWSDKNDADIGQTVDYKSEIKVKDGAVNYTFRDKMDAGLTLDVNSIKVQVNGVDVDGNYYTLNTGNAAGNYTFTIAFDNDYIAAQKGETIVITYSATLNENAVIGVDGNKNTASLEYGNKAEKDSTPDSITTTNTWKFDVEKYANVPGADGTTTEKKLAGATFTLSKNQNGTSPIAFVSMGNNVYRVAKTGEANTVTAITTDTSGKFTLQGMDSDTYYLTETKAPDGYNKLSNPVTVVIDKDGKINKTEANTEGESVVKVLNNAGSELPSTGGMGTTIFYVVGSVLMLVAVVILITKRRMNSH